MVPGLKNDQEAAGCLELLMRCQDGILHAKASTLTGTIVLRYDARLLTEGDVIASVGDIAADPARRTMPALAAEQDAGASLVSQEIGRAVCKRLIVLAVKAALRGSAVGIIAELL